MVHTYKVRSRHDNGISSPSLYPSLPLPLVFSADPNGDNTARPSRAALAGNEWNKRRGDMFARSSQAKWPPHEG